MTTFNAVPIDETALMVSMVFSVVAFLICLAMLFLFAVFSYRFAHNEKKLPPIVSGYEIWKNARKPNHGRKRSLRAEAGNPIASENKNTRQKQL